jgi:hypothetical protein
MLDKGSDSFFVKRDEPRLMVETVKKSAVLFIGNDEDSKKLLEDLRTWGVYDLLKIVNVSANGLRGWLLVEYGSARTPLLVTDSAILTEYEEIKDYIKSSVLSSRQSK